MKQVFHEYLVEEAASEATRLQHLARYRFAAQLVGSKDSILDIAAGRGYGAACLRDAGAKLVVAGDISLDALAYGRRSYSEGVQFIGCDAHNLPFRSSSFDAIVSLETIEHLAQPDGFLEECQRILKPSGLLIISTPNRAVSSPHAPRPLNPFHVREFWPWEFRRMLGCYFEEVRLCGQVPSRRGKLLAFTAYALGKFGPLRALLERTARALSGRLSEAVAYTEDGDGQFGLTTFSWGLLRTYAYMVAVCRKEG